MKQLSQEMFEKIGQNILKNARPLEMAKWKHLFSNGGKSEIEMELLKYQNEDGGFGSGHEIAVEKNMDHLIDTLREDGTWRYQDSWDTSTEPLRKIASDWAGYHAVKKMYPMKTFGTIS